MSIAQQTSVSDSPFVRRFDTLWGRLRRVRLGRTVALGAWLTLGLFVLLCGADYWLEWPRAARIAALAMAALSLTAWLTIWLKRQSLGGSRPRTAADIERAFPQLGQSVRTTIQYSSVEETEVERAGVRGALVGALRDDTHARSRSLNFDEIVPVKTVRRLVLGLVVAVIGMAAVGVSDPEWRTAAGRALLAEIPYTAVVVNPGDVKVDQGASVDLEVRVLGRPRDTVTLWTRAADKPGAEWIERDLALSDAENRRRGWSATGETFLAKIEAIQDPVEYRVTAGPATTSLHCIAVRYPLAIKNVSVELTPPAYTLQSTKVVADPNLSVLQGTTARFAIVFDQPPRTASLLMAGYSRGPDKSVPEPRAIPLALAGTTGSVTLELNEDFKYSILAETEDGLRLPENSYRVRVRPDQAPEVYFEEPRDALDVHTLAEILMRARIRDDYGLARAGIVFEVNNEEEYPLVSVEFPVTPQALREQGKSVPELQAALEKVLPLEFFELRQTDSVAYYAWVEDNRPDTPQRTVTDLRFIDIRPFRIRYSVQDLESGGGGGGGPQLASLEEIIKRQRSNLNRSMNFQRQDERGQGVDAGALEALVANETEIAGATRQLADFLSGFMNEDLNDEIQLLLQAESHMLAAGDSLTAGKYETAVLQQRDALKELIEGRDRLRILIMKNPKAFPSLGAADRMLAQKLRRPKTDAEEAAQIAQRLEQLASSQMEIGANVMVQTLGYGGSNTDPKSAEKKSQGTGDQPQAAETVAETQPVPETRPGDPRPVGEDPQPDEMTRRGLLDRQTENVLEAQDLKAAVEKLKNITEQAKERAAKGAAQVEEASQALRWGDSATTLARSDEAATTLRELARQVRALARQEAAEQLNEARQLAQQLADRQQQLAQSGARGPEGMTTARPTDKRSPSEDVEDESTAPKIRAGESEKSPDEEQIGIGPSPNKSDEEMSEATGERSLSGAAAAREAERNAETGRTILDVLKSALRSQDPADRDTVARLEALLKEQGVEETVERMNGIAGGFLDGREQDARTAAADNAERWEAMATRLEATFRELSAPKLDDLLKVDEELKTLQELLEDLQAERDVAAWHNQAERLLTRLEELGVGAALREELERQMRAGGWSPETRRFERQPGGGWQLSEERRLFIAPTGYREALRNVAETVQAHIQELLLGDLSGRDGEPAPPGYEHLIERYYQVLSRERRPTSPTPPPTR